MEFARISTHFEDILAQQPLIDALERQRLDRAFAAWSSRSTSGSVLEGHTGDPPGIVSMKNAMRWRSLSSRIFIHRPVSLWYALQNTTIDRVADDRRHSIETCRTLAHELIHDIRTTWSTPIQCQMSGWRATWELYQAVMVPLLSLFCDSNDKEVVEKSTVCVEMALSTLTALKEWSPTSQRSSEVVHRLYHAARCLISGDVSNEANQTSDAVDVPATIQSASMYDGFFVQTFHGGGLSHQADLSTWDDFGVSLLDFWDGDHELNQWA